MKQPTRKSSWVRQDHQLFKCFGLQKKLQHLELQTAGGGGGVPLQTFSCRRKSTGVTNNTNDGSVPIEPWLTLVARGFLPPCDFCGITAKVTRSPDQTGIASSSGLREVRTVCGHNVQQWAIIYNTRTLEPGQLHLIQASLLFILKMFYYWHRKGIFFWVGGS